MDDGEHSAVVNFLKRDNNSGSAVESLRIAAIEDTAGKVLFQQTEDHTSRVQCFALLRADRAATTGFLVLHGNGRRTMRGPILSYVNKALKSVGDGHIRLGLTPCVDSEAMRRAIEEGEIQRVRLIRYVRPEGRTTVEDQWFPRGQVGVEEFFGCWVTALASHRTNPFRRTKTDRQSRYFRLDRRPKTYDPTGEAHLRRLESR